jgi:heme/copper-type cytochrome/quinol oxidase subunit 3
MSETPHAKIAPATPAGYMHTGLDNAKLGMWIFLATEVMLFSALIASFLSMASRSPATANDVLNIPITAGNTFILIISSTTVVLALENFMKGNRQRGKWLLVATALLGAFFLSVQIYEYRSLIVEHGLTPSSSLFGSGFFTVTGFHGFHVFLGVIACIWLIIQAFGKQSLPRLTGRTEVFGLYWHFVDVVWIILFTIIYLL